MEQHGALGVGGGGPGLLMRLFPPLGDRRLALFYRQLATMLEAGVALDRAVEVAGRGLGGPAGRRIFGSLVVGVRDGDQLCEHAGRFPHVFPAWHVQMLRTGEQSGHLPAVLRELSETCSERLARRRALVSELIYPAVVVHVMFFLWRVPELILGTIGLGQYLLSALGPLVPLYLLGFGIYAGGRLGAFSPALRHGFFSLVHAVPVVGSAVRKLGIARFAMALRSLYEAGMDLQQALPIAGRACGNEVLSAAADRAAAQIAAGSTLYEAVRYTRCFPERTLNMLATGEESGRLDQTLAKIEQTHGEEARHAIRLLGRALGIAVYMLVALMVAVRVISFYAGYIQSIQSI